MFATSKTGFCAQSTMKVLLEIVLLLIVYSQLYPVLIEPYLETQISTSDPITAALLSIIPFVIAAMIIIGILSWNILAMG